MRTHTRLLIVLLVWPILGWCPRSHASQPELARFQQHARSLFNRKRNVNAERSGRLNRTIEAAWAAVDSWRTKLRRGQSRATDAAALREIEADLRRIDGEYTDLLRDAEQRLLRAGLADKASAARQFALRYRQQMEELQAGLAALRLAQGAGNERVESASIETLTTHLAAIAAPAETPRPEGVRTQTVLPEPVPHLASSQQVAADQPAPEDMAESAVIQLTPQIRARAAALGNSLVRIYAYVRDNCEYEPYYGSLQGSAGVYWSGRGNTDDLASFLIALLRSAGIPARAVRGQIQTSYENAQNWAGAPDKEAALRLLKQAMYVETLDEGVKLEQVWVQAWFNDTWVALDPSFRLKRYQPGIRLSWPAFDRMTYFGLPKTRLASDVYLDAVRDSLARTNPGRALSDVFYIGSMAPGMSVVQPAGLPYKVIGVSSVASNPDPKSHHRVKIEILDEGKMLTSAEFSVPETLMQPIAVTFGAATASDRKAIEVFDGLANTPAFAASLVAQIRLGEKIVATAQTGPAIGASVDLNVTYTSPAYKTSLYVDAHHVKVGETAVIAINGMQATGSYIGSLIDACVNSGTALAQRNTESALRQVMYIAGLRFLERHVAQARRLADPLQLRVFLPGAEETAVKSTVDVQNLFDRPLLATPSSLTLDAGGITALFRDLNSASTSGPEYVRINQVNGLTGSSLEHELWEEIVLTPSISTTRALQLAAERRIPILSIDKTNAAAQMSRLQLPAAMKTILQTDIDAGKTIVTPDRTIQLGNWNGLGWISEGADGTAGFLIVNLAGLLGNGGSTTSDPSKTGVSGITGSLGDPAPAGGTACGAPVSVANGNMFHRYFDLGFPSPGGSTYIERTYNSMATDGPFGHGWTHNYNLRIQEAQNGVALTDGTGASYLFAKSSSSYTSPPGLNAALTRDAQSTVVRLKSGTQYRFDSGGKLAAIVSRNNNTWRFTYDTRGNLLTVSDQAGRRLLLVYDSLNHVTSVTDTAARVFNYHYDSSGNLIESQDAAGSRTTYTYYADSFNRHNLKSITAPTGETTTFEYYGNDKVSRIVFPGGGVMRFLYLPMRNETTVLDERGNATTYQYNALGNVTRTIKPDGNYIDTTWSADAKLLSRTDEAGFTTSYAYDASGNLTSATNALGHRVEFAYEPVFHDVTSYRDARGNLYKFQYDARGNLVKITDPAGGETTATYDEHGNPLSVTNAEKETVNARYDDQGNQVEIRDALGATLMKYDSLSRPTSQVDRLGNEIKTEYRGLEQRLTDASNQSLTQVFDGAGRLTEIRGPGGQTIRYGYDSTGALGRIVDPAGNVVSLEHAAPECSCASAGSLSSIRLPAGPAWAFAYRAGDTISESRDPAGNTARYSYDARGNLVAVTDRNGLTTGFEYDGLNRLVRKVLPDGGTESYAYDRNGNLIAAENASSSLVFEYDALDRMISETDAVRGTVVRYSYDKAGRRTSMTAPDGGVTRYSWNANGELESITPPRGEPLRFEYDSASRRSAATLPNGVRVAYRRSAAGRLEAILYTDSSGGALAQWLYQYDALGRRSGTVDGFGTHSYEYDDLNRLTGVIHSDGPAERYSYDSSGNRLTAGEEAYVVDGSGRLASAGAVSFTYDRRGNPLVRAEANSSTSYEWDAAGRLVKAVLPDGRVASYKYDAIGRRTEKNVDGTITRYVWDGPNMLMELDGAGQPLAAYVNSPVPDEVFAVERGGSVHTLVADGQGTIMRSVGPEGPSDPVSYDSFGRPGGSGLAVTTIGFQGRDYDAETGLYYFRYRYYDPRIGRFLTEDPLGFSAGFNPYAFEHNDPVNLRDPLGLKVKVDPSLRQEYDRAIQFLRQDKRMNRMIRLLESSPTTYEVTPEPAKTGWNTFLYNAFSPNVVQREGNWVPAGKANPAISWDPKYAYAIRGGGEISPAVILGHEIAHASHYDTDARAYMHRAKQGTGGPGFPTAEEQLVVQDIEKELQRMAGEPARKTYDDSVDGMYAEDVLPRMRCTLEVKAVIVGKR
jgi:RHS repeat-associated protein